VSNPGPARAVALALALTAVAAAAADARPLSFAPQVGYTSGGRPSSAAVADVNRDGKPDLLVSNGDAASVSVLLGKGDGTFGAHADFTTGDGPGPVVAADFDRDGKPDLAVANTADTDGVSVLLGNGDGTFAAHHDLATGDATRALATTDLNRDGKPDIAAVTSADKVAVLLGDGDGGFAPKTDFAAGNTATDVAAGDLDRDGKPDLAVSDFYVYPNSIAELLGDGAGGLGPLTPVASANQPLSLVLADLNRDGKLDVAAPNYLDINALSVALGHGDGTFAQTKTYSLLDACPDRPDTFCNPGSIAAGDLDGDAVPDLVTTVEAGGLAALRGIGGGAFGPALRVGSRNSGSVAIADLDRDGRLDLVTAAPGLAVLLNRTPPATRSLTLTVDALTWSTSGVVRVPLRNPNPYSVVARARVVTATPIRLRPSGPKRVRTLAQHAFWIGARRALTVGAPLTDVGRRLLAKKPRRRIRLVLTTQGPAGAPVRASILAALAPAR
jgi:FG-GAP-like repeat